MYDVNNDGMIDKTELVYYMKNTIFAPAKPGDEAKTEQVADAVKAMAGVEENPPAAEEKPVEGEAKPDAAAALEHSPVAAAEPEQPAAAEGAEPAVAEKPKEEAVVEAAAAEPIAAAEPAEIK